MGFFPLSHHTCLQEEMVMSPTSHFGTMVAGRKQQVEKGGGSGEKEGRGCQKGLKKLSVLFTMDTMFWPLCLSTITLAASSSCPPSILSFLPLILYQPLLIHHMAWAQRHEFPIY